MQSDGVRWSSVGLESCESAWMASASVERPMREAVRSKMACSVASSSSMAQFLPRNLPRHPLLCRAAAAAAAALPAAAAA